jgi:hypothetical protein
MSALAIIALSQGYRVSGSDARASAQLDAVREAGATCFVGHDARHVGGSDARETSTLDDPSREPIVDPPDAVVVSSAVPGDNVEVAFARETGIPVFSRAQWLARVTRGRSVAAVAGTHGKTSTSAALAVALRSAGLDVSAIVGGNVPQFPNGRNAVGGGDDVFVVEADEYDGAFLGLEPTTAVLLNVEHDHPDMFEDERAVIEMFARFLKRVKPGGTVVACGDDANVRSLVNGLPAKVWDQRDDTSDDELLDDDSLTNEESLTPELVERVYDAICPGLTTFLDGPRTFPLVAPRPMLIVNGELDPWNPLEGVRGVVAATRRAYASKKKTDAFVAVARRGVAHQCTPEMLALANAWLDWQLRPAAALCDENRAEAAVAEALRDAETWVEL